MIRFGTTIVTYNDFSFSPIKLVTAQSKTKFDTKIDTKIDIVVISKNHIS